MKKKKRPNTMDQFRDGSYTDRERYAERENKIGGTAMQQDVNVLPNLTAKQEKPASAEIKRVLPSTTPAGPTIKRVQQLPVPEAVLKLYGGILNFQEQLPALLKKLEDWLNSQQEVIRFSNCPVLLPPDLEAHFIFEDAEKLELAFRDAYYSSDYVNNGRCVQPKLNVPNLKFDFMDSKEFGKVRKLLKSLYSLQYYTVYEWREKNCYYTYIDSDEFISFNGCYHRSCADLLICRIPAGQPRSIFILNKGLVPVITDVEVRKVYLFLKEYQEKGLLLIKDNAITINVEKKGELARVVQAAGLWQEPKTTQDLGKVLYKLKKNVDEALLDNLQAYLLSCDKVRFDLTEYDKMLLEDPNRGSWELWDAVIKQERMLQTASRSFYARDPRRDIVDGGVVGIDFGTKSTVVMTQDDSDAIEPVRIGIGNVQAEPKIKDYENPTVMEFIDIASFEKAYQQSGGRPLTHWEDATSSHTAFDDWKNNKSSGNYFSFFAELKQWAGDPERRVRVRDTKGKEIDLPPYAELPENSFDPIELYAYYIGLYINNQYTKRIYMEYLLSFPVTYTLEVRNRILKSFRKGIMRSLPMAVLQDKQCMEQFSVEQGVSEPAAYAVCALQEYKLFPKENEKIAYAIFDFGGGTTDFDFGIWRKANGVKERRYHYVIEHFGDGGDKYLGGENLLELLAFHVFCKNKTLLRKENIVFVKPPECERFVGYEGLLSDSQEAYSNMRQLMERLRGFWEGELPEASKGQAQNGVQLTKPTASPWFRDGKLKIELFTNSGETKAVDLLLNSEELTKVLRTRIEQGVESFFDALLVNFSKDKYYEVAKESKSINIFLAGNSSKSPILQAVFKEKITKLKEKIKAKSAGRSYEVLTGGDVIKLYQPLGADSSQKTNDVANKLKRPTGKTGVAIGLVQCRKGSTIKVISEKKVEEEIKFKFFVGYSDEHGYFESLLNGDSKYNEWVAYLDAGEDRFEFYYTSSTSAGRKNGLLVKEGKKSRQKLPPAAVNEDWVIYLCAVAPNKIAYAVAEDDEALKRKEYKFGPVEVELNY